MNPSRWQLLKEILERAFGIPESERQGFLEKSCGQDEELRLEIESLLRVHTASNPFDEPAALHAIRLLHEPPPQTLGPYKITRHIGAGGSSDVYLADRAGGDSEERVAIKILHMQINGDDMRRSFERERQILAGLDHPNIVRLLGGGITVDGRPYLILELIEGPPITVYLESKQFSAGRKLSLFITICDAVAYAHDRGVVHLDLKPSNILTSKEGAPKLVDFGVAGLMAVGGGGPQSLVSTPRRWTPAYSGPEYTRGETPGPTSDVYSLGLILCELLLGRPAGQIRPAVDLLLRPMRAIAAKCLEDQTADRYRDARALLEPLRTAHRRIPGGRVPE